MTSVARGIRKTEHTKQAESGHMEQQWAAATEQGGQVPRGRAGSCHGAGRAAATGQGGQGTAQAPGTKRQDLRLQNYISLGM